MGRFPKFTFLKERKILCIHLLRRGKSLINRIARVLGGVGRLASFCEKGGSRRTPLLSEPVSLIRIHLDNEALKGVNYKVYKEEWIRINRILVSLSWVGRRMGRSIR